MKIIFPILASFVIAFISAKVFAACDLPANYSTENYQDASALEQLFTKTEFSKEQSDQVFKTAKYENKVKKTNMQIHNLGQAVMYLVDFSRWGNAYIFESKVVPQNKMVSVVMYYPNAKPHGLIFAHNTAKIIATVSNGKVSCR